jgi:hypothetical protein
MCSGAKKKIQKGSKRGSELTKKKETKGIWTKTKKIYIFLYSTIDMNILVSIHVHRTGKKRLVVLEDQV